MYNVLHTIHVICTCIFILFLLGELEQAQPSVLDIVRGQYTCLFGPTRAPVSTCMYNVNFLYILQLRSPARKPV